jgi:hypothetical protein
MKCRIAVWGPLALAEDAADRIAQKWVNHAVARRQVWNQVTSREAESDGSSRGGPVGRQYQDQRGLR